MQLTDNLDEILKDYLGPETGGAGDGTCNSNANNDDLLSLFDS